MLHTTPSMFGKFSVHAWWYCGGLNEEHSILVLKNQVYLGMPKGAKMSLALELK